MNRPQPWRDENILYVKSIAIKTRHCAMKVLQSRGLLLLLKSCVTFEKQSEVIL